MLLIDEIERQQYEDVFIHGMKIDYINPFWEYLMDGNWRGLLNNKTIQLKLQR